jgi:streptogramin lyase
VATPDAPAIPDAPAAPDAPLPDAAPPDATPLPDAAAFDCDNIPPLPAAFNVYTGFSNSEDFAFDDEGNLVSTASNNLTKQPKSGASQLFVPNIGSTAGTRYLPSGELVIASVSEGSLLRVSPSGGVQTVLSGLAYPNGVEVGDDGYAYVAENNGSRVRRINPETGAFEIIATGLDNPNGVSFSPDYKKLYVGSFGAGVVYVIKRNGDGTWSAPAIFGSVSAASGGYDGLAVDVCGNVYVTVFVDGTVWRFGPAGGDAELVASLGTTWIPNLHWGVGIGGWDADKLYVIERGGGRVYELLVGVPEKPRVFP